MEQVAEWDRLRYLDLRNCKVSDADLAQIAKLSGLQRLMLDHNPITDDELAVRGNGPA